MVMFGSSHAGTNPMFNELSHAFILKASGVGLPEA